MNTLSIENDADAATFSTHTMSFKGLTAETATGAHSAIARYGFRLGELGLLFPDDCLGEILIAPTICPIPFTRAWMHGVITLRGNLIPVFDLQSMLFETPVIDDKPMVLILDQEKQAMGFVLKNFPQWLTGLVETAQDRNVVPEPFAGLVDKVYRQQQTTWLALNKIHWFSWLGENAKSC